MQQTILSPLDVAESNIENFRQNKLRYVERDLRDLCGVPVETTRLILRARGIEKWIANRRDFIHLKNELKDSIREVNERIPQLHGLDRQRAVGQMEGMMFARAAIRSICHSSRFRPETE